MGQLLPVAATGYLGVLSDPPASNWHCLKSIFSLHFLQVCSRLNSSEKISTSVPQLLHLHTNDSKSLNDSNPGQWLTGVFIFCLLLLGERRPPVHEFSVSGMILPIFLVIL